MAAVWQQVLALDARFNAYRAPNNPQFSKYAFVGFIDCLVGVCMNLMMIECLMSTLQAKI